MSSASALDGTACAACAAAPFLREYGRERARKAYDEQYFKQITRGKSFMHAQCVDCTWHLSQMFLKTTFGANYERHLRYEHSGSMFFDVCKAVLFALDGEQ